MTIIRVVAILLAVVPALVARTADYPEPKTGEWIAREFRFHTGEVLPEVRLAYTTLGDPGGFRSCCTVLVVPRRTC